MGRVPRAVNRRKSTALVAVVAALSVLVLCSLAPAGAADATPTVHLTTSDGLVTAVGSGFAPQSAVAVAARIAGGQGSATRNTDSTGSFKIAFRPPPRFAGSVVVVARSGAVQAEGSIVIGASATPPAGTGASPAANGSGEVLLNGDFETGDFSQYDVCQTKSYNQPCKGMPNDYPLSIVPATVAGRSAARFEVRDGDVPFCCGERSQLVAYDTTETEGKDLWYDWSYMIDKQYPITDKWQLLFQWHSEQDGSPPMAFYTSGTNIVLETRPRPNAPYTGMTEIWSAPFVQGQWAHVRLHVKWSADPKLGSVELWKDNVRQTFVATPTEHGNGTTCAGKTVCGFRNIYPGDAGNRLTVSYYRDETIQGTGIVYADDVKVTSAS